MSESGNGHPWIHAAIERERPFAYERRSFHNVAVLVHSWRGYPVSTRLEVRPERQVPVQINDVCVDIHRNPVFPREDDLHRLLRMAAALNLAADNAAHLG